ncbi:TPA: hypothetical protein IAB29_02370 [Candidatus Ventrenecus stercoripullorum]|nr:hypothetical protein [Candidatus Ventrenecus stercoripullorum]
MKLEKFKEKNKKKTFIIVFTVCSVFLLAGVFLYTSFASFTEDKKFNVINGTYQDPGDLYFAVYVDGEITNTFPSKDSGYTLDITQSSCTNGATISWDNETWSALVNFSNYSTGNTSRTKSTMYFKEMSFTDSILACNDTAANYIKDNASLSKEIATDDPDNNARYIGANPNNYVSFNNELWRIIGAFNNIDNGTGTKETRLKIIRDEPLGIYSWDSKGSYAENDWSKSVLQQVLNSGAYYNRTTGMCSMNISGTMEACDFSSNGLTSEAKTMIDNAVWNLGGTASYTANSNGLAVHFYGYERGTNVYSGRSTTWIGQIGLMYASDYGYATSGEGTTDRASCLEIALNSWGTLGYSECYNNDWLYDSTSDQWTLTLYSGGSDHGFAVSCGGDVYYIYGTRAGKAVSPVLYLSSNVKITGGTGKESDPFILSL